MVDTGGFIEHVLTQSPELVGRYIDECRELGFDIAEVSLVERVQKAGLKAKPKIGIQFGAGGATPPRSWRRRGRGIPRGCCSSGGGSSMPALWGTKSLWGRVVTHQG